MRKRAPAPSAKLIQSGDLISDNRLKAASGDRLEHESIGRGVAEIAWAADGPVNIALYGAWGSGKSSVYPMIEQHLHQVAGGKAHLVRYDAWKYGGQELKRNFVDSLARDMPVKLLSDARRDELARGMHEDQVKSKLAIGTWIRENCWSLLIGLAVAVLIAALWVVLQAWAADLFTKGEFKATARALLSGAGTVFGLALVATTLGPKVLEGAVVSKTTSAPQGADQFAQKFAELVDLVLKRKDERLVVFIDELDRCQPQDVVSTLADLKTFLDNPRCAFIVAADRDVIQQALTDELKQARPIREDEPYYATPGAFLDKIFQHQIVLPPLRSRALTQFAYELVKTQSGVWAEIRAESQQLFDLAIFALVPVHIRSPRRVKVLLNSFASNARIAQARGIAWLPRTLELAVLTVLQTEFPAVADDLRRVPRLLAYLRGDQGPTTKETEAIVSRHLDRSWDEDETKTDAAQDTVAGALLMDADAGASMLRRAQDARKTLAQNLHSYLRKAAAAGIEDPHPDLIYLQPAAPQEDLADPALADVIDFATDTAPGDVVAAFADQASSILAVVIPRLVGEADDAYGPGAQFAFESACRLFEQLDRTDHAAVISAVGPSILAAAQSQQLTTESIPGAVLVASGTSGAQPIVRQLLKFLPAADESLLTRMGKTLPSLPEDSATLVMAVLAERFTTWPDPLLKALGNTPIQTALTVWRGVSKPVLDSIASVELPEPATSPAQQSGAQAAVGAPQPVPTGEGVVLLQRLIDIVKSRDDGELLLSEILGDVQRSRINPLKVWVYDQSDALIATMASDNLRATHCLLGFRHYNNIPRWWTRWVEIGGSSLPPVETENLVELGSAVFRFNLLPTVETGKDLTMIRSLTSPLIATHFISGLGVDDTVELVDGFVNSVDWRQDLADEEATNLFWARRTTLYEALVGIAGNDAEHPVWSSLVKDLRHALDAKTLSDKFIRNWQALCEHLPPRAVEALVATVEEYESPADHEETAALLAISLWLRARAGLEGPAADALLAVPEGELTTGHTDAWLALDPSPADVQRVIARDAYTASAIRDYGARRTVGERTMLWISLIEAGRSAGLRKALAHSGIGPAAVVYLQSRLSNTNASDRRNTMTSIIGAAIATEVRGEVRKAASEVALALLVFDTGIDLRTAAEVVLWSGGAGHGFAQPLREAFTVASEKHNNLSNANYSALTEMKLLPKRSRVRRAKSKAKVVSRAITGGSRERE